MVSLENRALWSKERALVCGPSFSGSLSAGASVSLCGSIFMWVKSIGGRVHEIPGFCPSKALFLHKLSNPFLVPWQMPGEDEKVHVGLLEWLLPFSKLSSSRRVGAGASVSKVFSAVSLLSPRSQPRPFRAVLDYSGPLEKVLRWGFGEGRG